MSNTQNLATVGVTNRQDTDNIIVEQGGNIRRVQYEDIKTDILKGDAADGTISTFEESAEEFPIPAPATPQKTLWGRVKKFCSDFNDWKTGVMLFGHLVNNAESDSDTLPLAASVAKLLQEQITTNTSALAQLNSEIGRFQVYSAESDVTEQLTNEQIYQSIFLDLPAGKYLIFSGSNCTVLSGYPRICLYVKDSGRLTKLIWATCMDNLQSVCSGTYCVTLQNPCRILIGSQGIGSINLSEYVYLHALRFDN